jgi:hypothetical protein
MLYILIEIGNKVSYCKHVSIYSGIKMKILNSTTYFYNNLIIEIFIKIVRRSQASLVEG